MQYMKAKSAAKEIKVHGKELDKLILDTMKTISGIVGATLGPGGRQVLIERQEQDLPPMITKDGVTVFRSLGFTDPTAQAIMESARDSSTRTASEAGDGTTTATILAEAITRLAKEYARNHPRVSPQRVVRQLEKVFSEIIEPRIKRLSIRANLDSKKGRKILKSVATISANGDKELAEAVMECFDLVGDHGNVTIAEVAGPSGYSVEKIEGYPISMGFEESCHKFGPKFINDVGAGRVLLQKPVFVLYHGLIQDVQSLFMLLSKLGNAFESGQIGPNVVLAATGFSEQVLGYLGLMFPESTAINVFPLLVPQGPYPNAQLNFLQDLAAVVDADIMDPMNLPFEVAALENFGHAETFEASRFRSNIVGAASNQDSLLIRVDELQVALANSESTYDRMDLEERIGKLTGGIARLKVSGPSNGELKEKRDRAEDAVMAVRGAISHGCLPGGGWTLMALDSQLGALEDPVLDEVLRPALIEPVSRLLENVGYTRENQDEWDSILEPIYAKVSDVKHPLVFDCLEGHHVDAIKSGILDSTPAVLEAIRNSLSIASLLGTLGGSVAFGSDPNVNRAEARDRADFDRHGNTNEANERA